MLAGYLPFDDDPANPEGDNINLLYKYIVSTPLTFPEYVTPHARDLLRRILVPDPRKRADLFEVARHSWLSEYAHVVGFITSSTTSTGDIANTTVGPEEPQEAPLLARSASVREPSKTQKSPQAALGDLSRKHGNVDQDAGDVPQSKTSKDNKRRTVQVEYVAPRSSTQRGEASTASTSSPRTRARSGSQGPVEVAPVNTIARKAVGSEKPLPQQPPASSRDDGRPSTSYQNASMQPPTRPGREPPRSVSDTGFMAPLQNSGRPTTGGSMASVASRTPSMGLPSRGSYGQPVAPTVAGTNAHGRMTQPTSSKGYSISNPMLQAEEESQFGQLSITPMPPKFAKVAGVPDSEQQPEVRGHKRSNTIGGIGEKIFGRSGSIFSGSKALQEKNQERTKKSYPPVSMSVPVNQDPPRQSVESRRSSSFGFNKKRSGSVGASQEGKANRRFSLIPTSFSLKAIGIGKDFGTAGAPPSNSSRPTSRGNALDTRGVQNQQGDTGFDSGRDSPYQADRRATSTASPPQPRYVPSDQRRASAFIPGTQSYTQQPQFRPNDSTLTTESESSQNQPQPAASNANRRHSQYPQGFNESEEDTRRGSRARGLLQKNHRKFGDAYGDDDFGAHRNGGSSGAARKVMDFFRFRSKQRGGE
jgi:protein-serine/threonine kinase